MEPRLGVEAGMEGSIASFCVAGSGEGGTLLFRAFWDYNVGCRRG